MGARPLAPLVVEGDGNSVLREKALKISIHDDMDALMLDLIATMKKERGTGIAAPQIGVNKRVIVYMVSEERAKKENISPIPITGLANPIYVPVVTTEIELGWEGCLSVPGKIGLVPRYKEITYKGTNIETKETVESTVSGFHARVLQHEIDHLDGILYIDKAIEIKEQ